MGFSEVADSLIERIYSEDRKSQDYYLQPIAEMRKIPLEYLHKIGAFFVPNNEYIQYYGGTETLRREYDFYLNGYCSWTHFLMIPIKNLSGRIHGFVGWDVNNYVKRLNGAIDLPTYKTSNKFVFNKNHFFLTDTEVLRANFKHSTIFVVDGVFDAISLNCRGIPAVGLLGSSVSPLHYYFLHWFSHIYVVTDNDDAGLKLYRKIHYGIPRTIRMMQAKTKDIDDFFKVYPDAAEKHFKPLLANPKRSNFIIP